jgi:hypothetical protein
MKALAGGVVSWRAARPDGSFASGHEAVLVGMPVEKVFAEVEKRLRGEGYIHGVLSADVEGRF